MFLFFFLTDFLQFNILDEYRIPRIPRPFHSPLFSRLSTKRNADANGLIEFRLSKDGFFVPLCRFQDPVVL